MMRKIISTMIVQTAFSRNETSLSGAFTSGITLTNGDRAFRNVEGNCLMPPAGSFGVEMGFTFKDTGRLGIAPIPQVGLLTHLPQ